MMVATENTKKVVSQEEQYLNTAEVRPHDTEQDLYYIDNEQFSVCGVKVAIHLYIENADSKTKGGIILPGNVRNKEAIDSPVGKVVAIGPDAYKDKMFAKPYCKIGDWVVFPRSAITRMNWDHKAQIAYTEDVNITSVVPNPLGIKRAIPIDRF